LERVLVSPQFLFRIEQDPSGAAPGSIHRVADFELASRLSFFLWSSMPDDELLDAAAAGTLRKPDVLRAVATSTNGDSGCVGASGPSLRQDRRVPEAGRRSSARLPVPGHGHLPERPCAPADAPAGDARRSSD
jgi:hypothetical protein